MEPILTELEQLVVRQQQTLAALEALVPRLREQIAAQMLWLALGDLFNEND